MGKTPAEIAEKWKRRASAATEDYKAGIARVSESPTAKAASKQDKMLANLTKAVNDGKWAKGLKAVSLDDWKKAAMVKGAPNYSTGVNASVDKMEAFMGEVMPHIELGKTKIAAMPDITLEDSIARQAAWTRHMAEFKRKKYK